ncbi:MAG: MFS transporter, partial [Alicyclobacillaceae bacterium]|nr:MFS transporter [Alicyclobacillaceae bacterium]
MQTSKQSPTEFLDNLPMTRFHWLLVVGIVLAQLCDGYNSMATSYALPSITSTFHLSKAMAGSIPSTTNFGLLVGALSFSFLADRYGRKRIFQLILFVYAFGSFLSAISPNYLWLLVAQFIVGLGVGGEFPVAFALLAEFSPRRHRSKLIPLGPFFFSVGWVVAGLLALVVMSSLGWRYMYWIGVAPALVIIYLRRFVPESVRFLMLKNRWDEVDAVLKNLAAKAGVEPPPRMAEPPAGGGDMAGPTPRRRHAIRPLLLPMIALSILYFLSFLQNTAILSWMPSLFYNEGYSIMKSIAFTLVVNAVVPFSQFFSAWLQDVIPRKWAIALSSLIGCVFFLLFGMSFKYKWPIGIAILCEMVSAFFAISIISVLYTLATELFPTAIRSRSSGIITSTGRVGAIVGPLLLGVFLQSGTPVSTMIY